MSRTRLPRRMVVDRPAQLSALTSPVRLELLERFGLLGPCAVSDVAREMERAPGSLYYHVRKLVQVGLLTQVGERATSTRPEALYRLPAEEIEIARHPKGASARAHAGKAIHAILRMAGRELDAALDDSEAEDEGPKRRMYGRRLRGRLSLEALRQVNRHITAIENIFQEQVTRKRRGSGRSVAVTLVLTPGASKETT